MIPPLIRRLLWMTVVVAAVVVLYLLQVDARAGLYFGCGTLWALLNLLLWARLIVAFLHPPTPSEPPEKVSARRREVVLLSLGKMLLLVVGGAALVLAPPRTMRHIFALLGGMGLVFVVTLLKALGAWITNRDMLAESKLPGDGAGRQG